MIQTKEKKTLDRTVKVYHSLNYLYFTNTNEIIEVKINTESIAVKLALALNEGEEVKDIFEKFLSEEETQQLMGVLNESDMLTHQKLECTDFFTEDFEIPVKIKSQDSLLNIYHALETLNKNVLKIFSQSYTISPKDAKCPIWKKRGLIIDEKFINQCYYATVKIGNRALLPKKQSLYGFGFSLSGKREALSLAMLECLERLYTMHTIPKTKIHSTSYSQLKTTAINPVRFNWFSDNQYNSKNFKYTPFTSSSSLNWIEATSVTKASTTLLPRQLIVALDGDEKFVPMSSNGCAIHSCEHAALLAGIEEIIERDTLLKVWYHKISLPKISDAEHLINKNKLAQSLLLMGFHITLLDGTSDFGIPVIVALFQDNKDKSLFTLNAATGFTPEIAVEKLCKEFFMIWRSYILESDKSDIETILPDDVFSLSQHFDLHQNHKYKRERDFLKKSNLETKSIEMAWMHFDDVKQQLNYLAKTLSDKGFEIFKVDCSGKLLNQLGLVAIKVIIPDTIPLFVGKNLPLGIKRFQCSGELNTLPHPYC